MLFPRQKPLAILPFAEDLRFKKAFFRPPTRNADGRFFSRRTIIRHGEWETARAKPCTVEMVHVETANDVSRIQNRMEVLTKFQQPLGNYTPGIVNLIDAYKIIGEGGIIVEPIGKMKAIYILQEGGETFDTVDWKTNGYNEKGFRIKLALHLLHGLACLHQEGWSHHGIGPENLVLINHNNDSRAVLSDFSNAKFDQQKNKDLLDSPAYLPPEVITGNLDTLSQKSDVWQLGISLVGCWYPAVFRNPLLAAVTLSPSDPQDFAQIYRSFSQYSRYGDEIAVLLSAMIVKEPEARISAKDALGRSIFDPVRKTIAWNRKTPEKAAGEEQR